MRRTRRLAAFVTATAFLTSITSWGFAEPVKLAEKTPIRLRILREMTSGKVKVGEAVPYDVRDEIKDSAGRVLVAVGARGLGKVTVSKRRGMLGKQGKLEFTVESAEAVDGTLVPLRASVENRGKSNKGAVIASALLLTVLAVFVNGKDVTVKEGTEVVAYVDRDVTIDPALSRAGGAVVPVQLTAGAPAVLQAPDAKFTIVSSILAGSNVVGEVRNDGPNAAAAEIIVFVRKDGAAVGAGTATIGPLAVNEKKSFSVAIQGAVDGTISVEANAKAISPAPAAPIAQPGGAVVVSP
ncbi:MAG: hypothetical protein Q7T82_07520 [Armatimonadota bacterium]|nr:hypothetical protein [Armatimonadota bacterium]